MVFDLIKKINDTLDIFSNMELLKNVVDLPIFGLDKYVIFDKEKYKKNLVYRNSIYEIILIAWLPGQQTKLHDHPKNGCIMKIIEGELTEDLYTFDKIVNTTYKKNDISYIDHTIGKHIITNNTNNKTVSLHIYSPPNYYN